ncbi:FHA domain-containing protein [Myxococcota bacterium]|nr:FHA domain-containing protein [Myxococcota bacterium]MBU1430278.1 FHA domain-containing protein [Myxococcota bacterium]MBU1899964.1 FHA domain-containing protein [Myxococcota bacterium]
MRDPRDVLKGRIEAKVMQPVYNVRMGVEAKAQGAMDRALNPNLGKKAGATPQAKKKKMSWWPFGDEGQTQGGGGGCPSCQAEVDPSWGVCPYCGTDLQAQQAGQPPPPNLPGGVAPAPGAPNKTMAINLDDFEAPKKMVVGWLVIMNGAQMGTDFRLYEGNNTIGAAANNDIVITDEYLSSKHATIRVDPDGKVKSYTFIDHGSTNGSFLNETRVTDKELIIDNDSVRLGRTELRFKALY